MLFGKRNADNNNIGPNLTHFRGGGGGGGMEPSAPPLETENYLQPSPTTSFSLISSCSPTPSFSPARPSLPPPSSSCAQLDSNNNFSAPNLRLTSAPGSRNAPLPLSPTSASSLYNLRQTGVAFTSASFSAREANCASLIIGRRAARFELNSLKLKQNFEQIQKRQFNPLLLTHRRCTDACCATLFVVFLAGWALLAALAITMGRPERLIHPTDTRGRMCGHMRRNAYDLSSRPYLLFFDLTKCVSYVTVLTGCPTRQVCVQKCPTEYFSYLQLQRGISDAEFQRSVRDKVICDDSVNKQLQIANFQQLKHFVDAGLCTAFTVNSAAVVGRCLPQVFVDVAKKFQPKNLPRASALSAANTSLNGLIGRLGDDGGVVPTDQKLDQSSEHVLNGITNSRAILQKFAADLAVSWWQIIAFWAASAIVCLLYVVLLRLLGGTMIWLSIFALLGFLGVGLTFSWLRYKELLQAGAINDYSFQPVAEVYLEMPRTWLILAVTLSALFVVFFFVFLLVRTRIRLAVALIEETSKALGNMSAALFFPFFPFLLHVCIFALWGSITIWLSSSGEENCRRMNPARPLELENGERCDCALLGTPTEPNCRYVNITRNQDHVMAMQAYNLFALFWASCFASALSDMTIAGAFASHYFAFQKPKDVPSFPILRSFGRAIRYHIGTLAFGALILSIVKFMQVILDFLYNRLKGAENTVAKFLYRALSCLFYCLETFLRFLSKNAYIMTAIYGKGFCASAKESFDLLTRNIVRVVVLNRTTAFLLFIGKASITSGMGVLSYYYFTGRWIIDGFPQVYLYYQFVPVIAVLIGTYFVCDLFLEVYNMGVGTVFLCFLEDSETNDGSVEKPFYMSDNLKKILGKENKF